MNSNNMLIESSESFEEDLDNNDSWEDAVVSDDEQHPEHEEDGVLILPSTNTSRADGDTTLSIPDSGCVTDFQYQYCP